MPLGTSEFGGHLVSNSTCLFISAGGQNRFQIVFKREKCARERLELKELHFSEVNSDLMS